MVASKRHKELYWFGPKPYTRSYILVQFMSNQLSYGLFSNRYCYFACLYYSSFIQALPGFPSSFSQLSSPVMRSLSPVWYRLLFL
jgi:hypothetical protein